MMSTLVHETPLVSETKTERDYIASKLGTATFFRAGAKEAGPCAASKKATDFTDSTDFSVESVKSVAAFECASTVSPIQILKVIVYDATSDRIGSHLVRLRQPAEKHQEISWVKAPMLRAYNYARYRTWTWT
jgi:hypothetical protein